MDQILLIFFGWLLGLLSPAIVEKIKSEYSKKQFFNALCTEFHDLQYRVAIVSFLLGRRFGSLDNEYLAEIKPVIENYKGSEPNKSVAKLIDSLLKAEGKEFQAIINHMRAEQGIGLGLKTFSPSFLESNIALISKLPIELQSKIHEFRNHLNILNQEIIKANEDLKMTFDSSITDENHEIITNSLTEKYALIQGMSKRVVEKLGAVLSTTKSNNKINSDNQELRPKKAGLHSWLQVI